MNYRNVKFWILIFIFSCMHLVQCKYLHRRNDDTDNTVQGKPSLLLEVDKDGNPLPRSETGAHDTIDKDGESSAPDKKDKDGESSAPEEKDKDGESSAPDEKDKDGKSSAPDKKDKDGESSAPEEKDKDNESSAPDEKDKDSESSASDRNNYDGKSPGNRVLDDRNEKPVDTADPDDIGNDVAEDDQKDLNVDDEGVDGKSADNGDRKMKNCWFPIGARKHFIEMDKLDRKFKEMQKEQRAASSKDFDKKMLTVMLKTRSIAERALQNFGGDPNLIPAGLNLGGYCMMRMPQSILFFHRLKLRNNTRFRVNYLQNDLSDMLLTLRLSLNDLHLLGDYERAITSESPSTLFYTPTYGEVEFLLRDVEYKVEGRYRLFNDRLYVEHIISELHPKAILMRYRKENHTASTTTVTLQEINIYSYLQRMRNDLDHWLKDYFNDFLIYLDLPQTNLNPQKLTYENAKTIERNRFADRVIKGIRKRLRQVNASSIMIPDFKIYTINEMEITLYDGVVRGLDSIYRRSVATGKLDEKKVRYLDTIVGFSSLKVEYKYNMFLSTGLPPLFGLLVMDADELTSRLALKVVKDSPTLDMHFALSPPVSKARSLIVEGPANRYIAKYKNILENQIASIMSNTMVHYMQQLDSLARCQTLLIGKDDPNYKTIDQSESIESKTDPTQAEKDDPAAKEQTDGGGDVPNPEPGQKLAEDYVVSRKESMELEFPPKEGDKKGEKMLLKVDEKFSLTRLNKGERRTG